LKFMPEKPNNSIRLEKINCPVCNCAEHELLFNAQDLRLKTCSEIFNIVKCAGCGFIFLNPRPIENEAMNFYPSDFNREGQTLIHRILAAWLAPIESSMIENFKKYKRRGKVIDVGCGSGRLMLKMQKRGFDVWGCELNADSNNFASKLLEGRIFYKKLTECNFPEHSFDFVTMFQSLEHMHNFDELFKEISRIIKDDGLVYIYVPNMEFFEFRLFGPYYYNLEVPRHLYCFTRNSIRNLLLRHGFKIDRFFRNHILEIALTPTSLHYGLWSRLEGKNIFMKKMLKQLTYLPLILIRFILRIFFIFDEQNLKVICYKA
jgi:2-polyprenyl-3-methyl-5-hydroxy-6-metoxy-1,4-benzoquinol methylase